MRCGFQPQRGRPSNLAPATTLRLRQTSCTYGTQQENVLDGQLQHRKQTPPSDLAAALL